MPRYVYPPRPQGKLDPRDLDREEKRGGWLAQYKYKGSRVLVHVAAGEVSLYNRHGSRHERFKMGPELRSEILGLDLDPAGQYVLDGELMDHFTRGIAKGNLQGTIVLYDVLWAGKYLYGVSQLRRLAILNAICRHPERPEPEGRALLVAPHLWLAETFLDGFVARWSWAAARPDLEGLVLRRAEGKIENMANAEYETPNLLRCRKSEKTYLF